MANPMIDTAPAAVGIEEQLRLDILDSLRPQDMSADTPFGICPCVVVEMSYVVFTVKVPVHGFGIEGSYIFHLDGEHRGMAWEKSVQASLECVAKVGDVYHCTFFAEAV